MKKLLMLTLVAVTGIAFGLLSPVHAQETDWGASDGADNADLMIGGETGPQDGESQDPALTPARRVVPAPIESIEVVPSGATPTGHALSIVAGLPGGCAEPDDTGHFRFGDYVFAYVLNTQPADPNTVCTDIYDTYEVTIDLGTDFVPGQEYTARVNDESITFIAHGGTPPPEPEREIVPAPIEIVDLRIAESEPPQYFVDIVAGLPNGCVEPDDYEVTRAGNRITIDVTNSAPTGDVMCTQIYRTYSLSVPIGSDFEADETYVIDVNGTIVEFMGQGDGEPPSDDLEIVDAPIESAEVLTLPSWPPQYVVAVTAGLPSGCAEPNDYEVMREGNNVFINVTNTMPAGNPVCTMIYRTYDLRINIGSDFVEGETYTVDVNGTIVTFTA